MEKWIEQHLEFWASTIYRADSADDQACKWNTLKQIKAFIERNPEEVEKYSWNEIARHADIDLFRC